MFDSWNQDGAFPSWSHFCFGEEKIVDAIVSVASKKASSPQTLDAALLRVTPADLQLWRATSEKVYFRSAPFAETVSGLCTTLTEIVIEQDTRWALFDRDDEEQPYFPGGELATAQAKEMAWLRVALDALVRASAVCDARAENEDTGDLPDERIRAVRSTVWHPEMLDAAIQRMKVGGERLHLLPLRPFNLQSGQASAVQALKSLHAEAVQTVGTGREVIARCAYNYAWCMSHLFSSSFSHLSFDCLFNAMEGKARLQHGHYPSIAARIAVAEAARAESEWARLRPFTEVTLERGVFVPRERDLVPFLVPSKFAARVKTLQRQGVEAPSSPVHQLMRDFSRAYADYPRGSFRLSSHAISKVLPDDGPTDSRFDESAGNRTPTRAKPTASAREKRASTRPTKRGSTP